MHNVNWDDLRFVLAVAEAGSVNAATRSLGVNHATVLRRISAFEDRHAIQIFIRNSSGYTVDPACIPVIEAIKQVGRSVDGFDRAIAQRDLNLSGPLRLTTTDTIANSILARLMPAFRKQFPRLRVEIDVTNTRLNLSRMDADLTIRPAPSLSNGLVGTRACSMAFMPYGNREAVRQPGTSVPWIGVAGDLKNSPLGAWEKALDPDLIVCTASSFPAMAGLAGQGIGLAMLPCCLGDPSPDLVRATHLQDRLETGLWVASHPDLTDVPRIAESRRFLVAQLQGMRQVLEGTEPGEG